MIRGLVDFALNNRFLMPALAVLLLIWGAISFHNLPVEAYPDVANNYVQVITQWPGRAAEEVEQQVTIPLEIVMNGIPHLDHLRSTSLFGLSSVMLIFDDESDERLEPPEGAGAALAGHPARQDLQPQIGTDYSPVGQIYWYTLQQHQSQLRPDGAEDRSRTGCSKSSSSRCPTWWTSPASAASRASTRCAIDPDKLVAYGLSIGQVEQQLANNNVNAGGSFVEAGLQQINVRAVGPGPTTCDDIAETVIKTQNGTPIRVSDIAHGRAGAEDPAGPDRQGDPPRGRQDRRQRRRGGRHRAAAQGRRSRTPRWKRSTTR